MRSVAGLLNNAATASSFFNYLARDGGEPEWCLSDEDTYGALSPDCPELSSLSANWTQSAFWVPRHDGVGFPLMVVPDVNTALLNMEVLLARGVRARHAWSVAELRELMFRGVVVYCGDGIPGLNSYNSGYVIEEEVVNWLADPKGLGCSHSDAYCKYIHHPLGITEDVWGMLGAWPWADLEDQLANFKRTRLPVDESLWGFFCSALDDGDVRRGLDFLDVLCKRSPRHKRRHYFDVVTLYKVCSGVWDTQGHGDLFRRVAKATLYSAFRGGVGYERLYLTSFWLWTTPYWKSLCSFFLEHSLYDFSVEDYRTICKEITARVTACWMFPMTNRQCMAAAYFLNAEDLTGFADNQESSGEVSVEVLEFALNEFEYTFPDVEGRTFSAYLEQFSAGVESMLEPLYRQFADKAVTYEDLMATRAAWGAGGVAGRRAREVLGTEKAPPGCTKAYAMVKTNVADLAMDWGDTRNEIANKMDERGPPRCITATDMRDQISETFAFKHFSNRYPSIGLDIGESPTEAMARHAQLCGSTRGRRWYQFDGRLITAWDWMKWDHYYHCAEKVIVLQRMRELTAKYLRTEVRGEVLNEIDDLLRKHEQMVYRSQSYADEEYGKQVDALIAESGGRAERLPGEAGRTSVLVKKPNGQQSGRKTTLEANTIVGTARLLVRDAELMGRKAHLSHRVALYVLNRADDVAEVHATYKRGVAAVEAMIRQGHRANPKKQVSQWRSVVYLRILYAGGSMRAFPPRAVYAATTGHPDKGAGSETSYIDKLRSVSKGLDMWVRRGGWMRMARALYSDAEHFFSSTRVWDDRGGRRRHMRVRVPQQVIRAAPEHGGLGILPPGAYAYDYSIKCSDRRVFSAIARDWDAKLAPHAKRTMGPGIHDLERKGSEWLTKTTGLVPRADEVDAYKDKWARSRMHQGGDGQSRFVQRCAQVARSIKKWHRDVRDSWYRAPVPAGILMRGMDAIRQAINIGDLNVGTRLAFDCLKPIRGLPAYGMVEHLWHGYGQVLMARRGKGGADALASLCTKLANATQLGRDFNALARHWSARARADHLEGSLGPAGGWDKLIPPSWSGWFNGIVAMMLAGALAVRPGLSRTRYGLLKLRAALSAAAATGFVRNYSELCLH